VTDLAQAAKMMRLTAAELIFFTTFADFYIQYVGSSLD
jgi:hypothetical protein